MEIEITHLRIASAGHASRCSSSSPGVVGTEYVVWRTNRRSGRGLIDSSVGRGMRVYSATAALLGDSSSAVVCDCDAAAAGDTRSGSSLCTSCRMAARQASHVHVSRTCCDCGCGSTVAVCGVAVAVGWSTGVGAQMGLLARSVSAGRGGDAERSLGPLARSQTAASRSCAVSVLWERMAIGLTCEDWGFGRGFKRGKCDDL